MTDTNAATTAAHNARMTASLSNSTRLVNTSAELAMIASTSNTVNSSQPGLRPLRRGRAPRVRTVMGRLYPPQVTQRVVLRGDSGSAIVGQLLRGALAVLRRLRRRLAAMLKPKRRDQQGKRTDGRHDRARRVRSGHPKRPPPWQKVDEHPHPPTQHQRADPRRRLGDHHRTGNGQRMQPARPVADLPFVDL